MSRGAKIVIGISITAVVAAFVFGLITRMGPGTIGGDTLGLLRVDGVIRDVDWYMEQVGLLRDNDRVRAVVLRINSPGGAIAPTQELYDEILKLRDAKPVVVSMGTVAASGGYYLSCASDWIISNPGTVTGSIGVIMEFTNLQDLFGKLGIDSRTIKSGKFKDTGHPFREMTEEEVELITVMIEDTYDQFVEAVIEGRPVEYDEILPYLDGRVFTGRQAHELGLVDELGNINLAMEKAAELAGLPEVPTDIVEPRKKERGLIPLLFGQATAKRIDGITRQFEESMSAERALQLWRAF